MRKTEVLGLDIVGADQVINWELLRMIWGNRRECNSKVGWSVSNSWERRGHMLEMEMVNGNGVGFAIVQMNISFTFFKI